MQTQAVNTNFGGQVLSRASTEWSRRPDDERFTSLLDLQEHTTRIRDASTGVTALAKQIRHQNERIELEREGGRILALAA